MSMYFSALFLSRRRTGLFTCLLGFLAKMRTTLWRFFLIHHLHHQPRRRMLLICRIIPNVVKQKPSDGSTFVRNEPQSFLECSQLLLRSTRNFEMPFYQNQDPCREHLAKDHPGLSPTPEVQSTTHRRLNIMSLCNPNNEDPDVHPHCADTLFDKTLEPVRVPLRL